MINKKEARLRRARRLRLKVRELRTLRLSIYRSNKHMYAQIVTPCGSKVLASASSKVRGVLGDLKNGGTVAAAKLVGAKLAQIALEQGIDTVTFDRSGYKYHGRVKALADAAREAGLKF